MNTILGRTTAPRTSSARITSIDISNVHAFGMGFVLQKLLKLIVRPRIVFITILLLSFLGCSFLQASESLKNKSSSRLQSGDNPFGHNVIDITSETVLFGSNLPKVPFPGMSFALKHRPQPLITSGDLFDMSSTKESLVGSNSKFPDSSVNSDELSIGNRIFSFFLEDDMEKDLVLSDKEFCYGSSPGEILLEVVRNDHLDGLSTVNGRQRDFVPVEPNRVGSSIISDAGLFGFRTGGLLFLLESIPASPQSFGCFHSSRDCKLRREFFSDLFVDFVMQRNSIEVLIIPSGLADQIESPCVGFDGRQEDFRIFMQSQFDSSGEFHIHIIQKKDAVSFLENGKNVRKFFSTGGAAIPPPPQGRHFVPSLPLVGMEVSSPQKQ
jgi:hypothetical protein